MKTTTWLENLLRVSVFENELLKLEKEELYNELNRLRRKIHASNDKQRESIRSSQRGQVRR